MMEFARTHGAVLVSLLPELRCETFWERVVQPIAAITLMQSFPLHAVNNDRSPLAFANGQYILIERTAYDAAGGHQGVRDRFVEDIAIAQRVKGLGLADPRGAGPRNRFLPDVRVVRPGRAGLEPHLLRCARAEPMAPYSQASRSDHLLPDRTPRTGGEPGVAGAAGTAARSPSRSSALSLAHHFFMYLVFRRIFQAAVSARTLGRSGIPSPMSSST